MSGVAGEDHKVDVETSSILLTIKPGRAVYFLYYETTNTVSRDHLGIII